jgi:hypothetical protein
MSPPTSDDNNRILSRIQRNFYWLVVKPMPPSKSNGMSIEFLPKSPLYKTPVPLIECFLEK